MLLTSGSPMTSWPDDKLNYLTIWRIWFCRALQPYRMDIIQYNDMDRVWDTSKHHPKVSVSILKVKVIQGHELKERSNWKCYVWAAWCMLGHFFVKNAKNDPRTLLNGPSRTNVTVQKGEEVEWTLEKKCQNLLVHCWVAWQKFSWTLPMWSSS